MQLSIKARLLISIFCKVNAQYPPIKNLDGPFHQLVMCEKMSLYVLITCFHKSWIFYIFVIGFFEKRTVFLINITLIIITFYDMLSFLNPSRTDQSTWQITLEKSRLRRFRIREKMWWTHYRSSNGITVIANLSAFKKLKALYIRCGTVVRDFESEAKTR